ncbi:MAG: plastocyanin/azurin family copper-binding protein [Solirubrobacterales bacterium]
MRHSTKVASMHGSIKIAFAAAAAASFVAAAVATPVFAGASAGIAKTVNVTIGDNFFSPKSVTVKKNDSVRWDWNNTANRHNVRVSSGPSRFSSKTTRGESYSYTKKFSRTGTYRLYCSRHEDDMKMTVRVKKPS